MILSVKAALFLFVTQSVDGVKVCSFNGWQQTKDNTNNHGEEDRTDNGCDTYGYRCGRNTGDHFRKYDSGDNANNTAKTCQNRRLCEKLAENTAFSGPNSFFQANFLGPFSDRYKHNIHNTDTAYQKGDAGDPDQLLVGRCT